MDLRPGHPVSDGRESHHGPHPAHRAQHTGRGRRHALRTRVLPVRFYVLCVMCSSYILCKVSGVLLVTVKWTVAHSMFLRYSRFHSTLRKDIIKCLHIFFPRTFVRLFYTYDLHF